MKLRNAFLSTVAVIGLSAVAQQPSDPNPQPAQPNQPENLPPGLEKRDELPPGLQKRDELPPGLAKRTNSFDSANTNAVGGTGTNENTTTGSGAQINTTPTNAAGGTGTNFGTSTGGGTNTTRFNRFGTNQPQSRLPNAGGTSGSTTATTTGGATAAGSANVNITVVNQTDQPIATEVRRVIVAEPALVNVLPAITIQIQQGGVVNLNGNVGCAAESALVATLIRHQVPRARIVNSIRVSGQ
jgi:hypothetical protein